MHRFISRMLLVMVILATAHTAHAQFFGGVTGWMKSVFRRNNDWPKPFIFADRESVALPYATMVNNGWRRQNLMCEYHFDDDTARLTPAGELKLQWILTQAPSQHRTVFVQRALQPEKTAARLELVQQASIRLSPNGDLADIVATNLETPSRSAEDVDTTTVGWQGSIPVPRLPSRGGGGGAAVSTGGGGGGGGSGSGSGR
jgi:uncharacterized membrane protein YgcG